MATDTSLTSVRQTLDKVTLEFFDTLESLYQSQARLEALMRGGFLSLSRARYSMGGPRNVGALQFEKNEMEMEAVSVVDVSTEDGGEGEGGGWTSVDISLVEKQPGVTKSVDSKEPEKTDDLRQRKGRPVETKEQGDTFETVGMHKETVQKDSKPMRKEGPRLKDPLTLFGVLVSPHLRQCQSSFKQAVAVTVEIANLKNKLQGLQQQFKQLSAHKQSILAS